MPGRGQPAHSCQVASAGADFDAFLAQVRQRYGRLPDSMTLRLARNYGTRIERILGGASSLASLGEPVLPGLYACELAYLVQEEFARAPQDILWRRTKLGLVAPADAAARLRTWLRWPSPEAGVAGGRNGHGLSVGTGPGHHQLAGAGF